MKFNRVMQKRLIFHGELFAMGSRKARIDLDVGISGNDLVLTSTSVMQGSTLMIDVYLFKCQSERG